MGTIVRIHDYHLRRVTKEAADRKGELVEFAKAGQPTVADVDLYAGTVCPEVIEGLLYETSMGWSTPYDAG